MSTPVVEYKQTVLVAYDGTEPTRRALAVACELADPTRGSLHVVIAARRSLRYGETMAETTESLTRAEQARKRLRSEVDAYCHERGFAALASVRPGRPVAELLRAIRRGNYDVVVLPARSRVGGLGLAFARRRAHRHVATVVVPGRELHEMGD
jgi:nucleotide-binding universal stress UspA family protein